MKWMNSLSLSSRLLLAFAIVPCVFVFTIILGDHFGALALWSIGVAVLCGAALALFAGHSIEVRLTAVADTALALTNERFDEPTLISTDRAFRAVDAAIESLRTKLKTDHDAVKNQREQQRLDQQHHTPREDALYTELTTQLQSVLASINELVKTTADGDLTRRLDVTVQNTDLRAIGMSVNSLIENMSTIVHTIQSTVSDVKRAADEITSGNENLSQRTEEQSSSLEETASSMEEMTTTVKQNADNAAQANQLALAARDQAERGGEIVNQAIAAMSDINQSSKKIADIIGVIDEIAFQTNLLALNAAVEAARAGEQGRGFAVVASEVRSLAGRSATAAKEIKGLIQDSVHKVEDGSSRVSQSGQTLDEIVTSVKKVSDIVAEIASASSQQSSGIEQVNRAVMQMDELTQQNATLVGEVTSAVRNMSALAETLEQNVISYRLKARPGRADAAAADTPMRRAVGS